ncbi:hypothetical protein PCANC_16007 [Puccinia coronata f. sp. avenae]|uniref:TECPR1-like DysF domain-containing protein n=1 Tax=Puccinia coronata f. sp. avenae TaxID=200324 RepID=A0A2N5VRV9_9BASI|nr:hypothetical protein PCANC_16007 [Puccinia coronata f. sp. avenae]
MFPLSFFFLSSTSSELVRVLRWTHPVRSAGLLLSHGILTLVSEHPLSSVRLVLLLVVYSALLSILSQQQSHSLHRTITPSDALLAQLLVFALNARPAAFLRTTRVPLVSLTFLLPSQLLAWLLPSLLRPHWAVYLHQLALLLAASPPVLSLCACLVTPQDNTRTPSPTTTTRSTAPPPPHHHQDPHLDTVHQAHTQGEGGVVLRLRLTLIEHQRWTEEHGWTAELTEEDKATVGGSWTDEAGGLAQSPSGFQLPAAGRKTEAWGWWRWSERQWTPERRVHPLSSSRWEGEPWEVDDDGWTYGDPNWRAFSPTPGFRSFTRKRRWTRAVYSHPLG